MARIVTALIISILAILSAYGQYHEPLDLAKRIFGKDSLPDFKNYITSEYEGRPNGRDLPEGAITNFSLLNQTEKTAVVAMTILDSSGKGIDTYLHFEKDQVWKMSAFRALAMTGIIQQMVEELEKMTPKQIDEIIKQSKVEKNKDAIFESKEGYDYILGNAKLTLDLDENIAKHFLNNQAEFESIKNSALNELESKKPGAERSGKLVENFKARYNKLFISSVSSGGYEVGEHCLRFLIGGMIDNEVGYLYVKDKKDLPEMSADRVIMIKEIGNGWYIYKTT